MKSKKTLESDSMPAKKNAIRHTMTNSSSKQQQLRQQQQYSNTEQLQRSVCMNTPMPGIYFEVRRTVRYEVVEVQYSVVKTHGAKQRRGEKNGIAKKEKKHSWDRTLDLRCACGESYLFNHSVSYMTILVISDLIHIDTYIRIDTL